MNLVWSKYKVVHRFILSRTPNSLQGDTDDILQETYATAWQNVDQLASKQESAVTSWLLTVAKRKLVDRVRTNNADKRGGQALVQSTADCAVLPPSRIRTPSSVMARRESSEILNEALTSLSERHRSAIQLRYFRRLSHADVAREMGLSAKAAQMLTKRAVSKLREAIGRQSRLYGN